MPDPWLDLTTKPSPRLEVRVDGVPHELPRFDDLSINERRQLARDWSRVIAIDAQEGDLSPADASEREERLLAITGLLLPGVPSEARARLGEEQREAVVMLFFGERVATRLERALATRALPTMPGGGRSSRASSATTEATPADG